MNEQLDLERIQNFKGTYPKQIWALAFTEMWERFCFYGNRALLTLFMLDKVVGLSLTKSESNSKYAAIQAFVYAFTFLGGLFADKIIGFKKSLLWGGILMIAANIFLFVNVHDLFYPAMCLLILGTGFFKPNISTMVGELYKDGDPRRDTGFNLFYAAINLGATFAGIICVYAARKYGYNVSFGLSALGPIGKVPPIGQKNKMLEYLVYGGCLLLLPLIYIMIRNTKYTDFFMYIVGPATIIYLIIEVFIQKLTKQEILKLCAAFVFIIASIFFWAFFEQSGGSLNIFADSLLNNKLLGFTIDPVIVNNSSNSFIVFLSSSFVGMFWLYLSKKKLAPSYIIIYAIGFLFLALGFYIFYYTKFTAGPDSKTSLNVFTLAYLVLSIAELCISPIGLSLMTMLSPKKLWGVMMGLWFLASAYGQYVAGIFGADMSKGIDDKPLAFQLEALTQGYKNLAIYALICAVVLFAIAPLMKKLIASGEDKNVLEI
jgi:proton-dependent oligopeptide transporter, POT family